MDANSVINSANFDEADRLDLEKAAGLLLSPTLTARISSLIGKPMDGILRYLPDGISGKLNELVHTALSKAVDGALWTLENKKQDASPWWNKAYAAMSGAAGGAFGFAGLAIELPVSTTILMRSVADIARGEGFDLADDSTKRACIEVFALGGANEDDDEAETTYYAMRIFSAEIVNTTSKELASHIVKSAPAHAAKWLADLIQKVAARFGIVITEKVAAQAIPVVGAVSGALINVMFTDFYQDMARGHFTIKRLEKKYGYEAVKQEFEKIRGEKLPGNKRG